ncbi:MAG: DotU family type IV/VI secretion system protein [Thermomonas sp.]|uniref:DotU family type IV/VI secretion system protein n=1 Tax=Thermomonas sp. TaxID=1971895 RepID=UPI0039E385E7
MPRLLHHFTPVFTFGLALDERVATNQASEQAIDVTTRARELIERAKSSAHADGKRPEQVDGAAFAAAAWIDEIMARNPAWLVAGAPPLQVTMFNTNNAGNEFFTHLSALKQDQDEVREVYYHALLCGFVGQYYYENGDTGELGKLKELHGRQLPVAPAPIHTLREEKITPQPYGVADPAGPRLPRQWDRALLGIGALVALLIPLLYLAYLLVAKPKPTILVPVQQALAQFPCSDLKVTADEDKGTVSVSGHVSRADDISAVQQRVAAIEGVKSVDAQVQLRIWPHCEVVKILEPYKARNDDAGYGLVVTPSTGHSDRFIEGEKVTIKVTQPNYDGYLYVDYYFVDGNMAHIFPHPNEPDSGRLVKAGETLVIGNTPEGWEVGAPFGQELITVISSPVPLYEGSLPTFDKADDYLPRLRQMMEANRDNQQLTATFLFMQTEPAQ